MKIDDLRLSRFNPGLPAVFFLLLLGWALARLPLTWAAGLVGGTAVFLLILIQPLVGLGLALLLGPLGALESITFGRSIFDSGQLMLWLTLAVWLARGLRRRQIIIPHTFLNVPLLLFLFVMALTLLNTPSIPIGLIELLKWVEILLIVWMIVDCGEGEEQGGRRTHSFVLAMLLTAGASQALVGVWQFGLRGAGPEHFLVLGRFYRAYGTYEQPNPFGGFMNLTALLALGALAGLVARFWQRRRAGERARGEEGFVPLLMVGGVAAVTAVALIASWSRGAWLGFGAGTAVLVFFWPRKRWQGAAWLSLGMALFLVGVQFKLIPPSITGRISSLGQDLQLDDARGVDINDANYAVLERLAHWQAALDMARDNLWLGVGFGAYEPAYPDYALINWPAPLGHAHNYYLNLLAETGVLGLAAYGLLWTAVFRQTIRLLKTTNWPQRGIVLGLLAAWTALAVHHLVDKLYVNNIYIHLGVMLGLLQLLDKETTRLETTRLETTRLETGDHKTK